MRDSSRESKCLSVCVCACIGKERFGHGVEESLTSVGGGESVDTRAPFALRSDQLSTTTIRLTTNTRLCLIGPSDFDTTVILTVLTIVHRYLIGCGCLLRCGDRSIC